MSVQYYHTVNQRIKDELAFEIQESSKWMEIGSAMDIHEADQALNAARLQESIYFQNKFTADRTISKEAASPSRRAFSNMLTAIELASPAAQTSAVQKVLSALDEMKPDSTRDFYISLLGHTGSLFHINNQEQVLTWLVKNSLTTIDESGQITKAYPNVGLLRIYNSEARAAAGEALFASVHNSPASTRYDDKLMSWALRTFLDEDNSPRYLGEIMLPVYRSSYNLWVSPQPNHQDKVVLITDNLSTGTTDIPDVMDKFKLGISQTGGLDSAVSLVHGAVKELSELFAQKASQRGNQPSLQIAILQAKTVIDSFPLERK